MINEELNDYIEQERRRLELEELALRVAALRAPWWRQTANLASIATIVVAMLGFVWASVTGMFDVARRELDVEKKALEMVNRELKEGRDEQRARFDAEKRAQTAEINRLKKQLDTLRTDLASVSKPIILNAWLETSTWQRKDGREGATNVIKINGLNFGTRSGAAELTIALDCPDFTYTPPPSRDKITPRLGLWTNNEVTLAAESHQLRGALSSALGTLPKYRDQPLQCEGQILVGLRRHDGRRSNAPAVPLSESVTWALGR